MRRRSGVSFVHTPARRSRRAGSVLLIVTLSLICLLGVAAVSVDVGQALLAAGRAQNVADACALAACGGNIAGHAAEAVSRVQQTLDANNYTGGMTATWNSSELLLYTYGQNVPGYGPLTGTDEAATVKVYVQANYTFARVFGFTTQTISRSATARRHYIHSGGNCLLFALETATNTLGLDISGTAGKYNGLVHSNTRVDVTGNKHRFTGVLEWLNRLRIQGSQTVLEQGDLQSVVRPDPVGLTPADFAPYDYEINGDYKVPGSGTVPPGCYRVHGSVQVTGSAALLYNVTFVADGYISFSGSNAVYTPARWGTFAYTLSTDPNAALSISASGPACDGLLYSPYGGASYTGSDYHTVSIVAKTIKVSGTNFEIAPSALWGNPGYQITLIN